MCGIVGYVGNRPALEIILSGLSRLEYRGYDSAGVAIYEDGEIFVSRALGKLRALTDKLGGTSSGSTGTVGIGHTRWATHGKPSETNAHPHSTGRISLIHNGIIENYLDLRAELEEKGIQFSSETDTEIAAQLFSYLLDQGQEPFEALRNTCSRLRGSYAFLAIDKENPDTIYVAKNATPIVIGFGEGESFVASDIPAVLPFTREMVVLEDGDLAELTGQSLRIENSGETVERKKERITWDPVTAQKGGYKHYMLKEIHEQPLVIGETFRGRLNLEENSIFLEDLDLSEERVKNLDRIVLVACGTAWHACLITKFYIEALAGIPCEVDYASEFRYRAPVFDERTLLMVVSQSGETADTLAALDLVSGIAPTLAICNVLGSTISRKADHVLFTHAGPEISVASTKAFTTQLVAGLLVAVHIGSQRGFLSEEKKRGIVRKLFELPPLLEKVLKLEESLVGISRKVAHARDFLYLGRGLCFPVALEGALKLKEISYLHAEGYPAGEMKHGPIALIDHNVPVVVVLQRSDVLYEKTLSNLREVQSREGRVIAVTDSDKAAGLEEFCEAVVEVPFLHEMLSPLTLTVPLQLLAYYVAVLNGTDVDLPRNLAKSVTVE